MSIIGSNILAGASGQATGYNINNSLRFRSSNSAYLSRTPASATNRKTWTWSGWVKRGVLGTSALKPLFFADTGSSPLGGLYFSGSGGTDILQFYDYVSPTDYGYGATAVYRDPSAWYHVVLAVDTTQATASNRIKLYVNGVQQTFNQNFGDMPQNYDTAINSTNAHYIGREIGITGQYFDGYMTEINFVDGTALTPSSFGETSTTTGSWIPKAYSGSYGTNGFYLKFADASAATAAAIGKDSSGNGNNWTPSGISVTSGVTYDAMLDVPTNTSATVANYAIVNPLDIAGTPTISDGNLKLTNGSAVWGGSRTGFAMTSGKWYWEVTIISANTVSNGIDLGIANSSAITAGIGQTNKWVYNNNTGGGRKSLNGTVSAYGVTYVANDVVGIAFDADAGSITCYVNNSSQGVMASTGLPNPAFPYTETYSSDSVAVNFGQRPFTYTPPTGFVALNTFNLPDSTIKKGNTVMDATTYTGNATVRSITNAGAFKPDFIWIKSRSGAGYRHHLMDSVRGANKFLFSNSTSAEQTSTDQLTSFNSDGFSLGADTAGPADREVNESGNSYVGWQWQAGQGTNTSNTSGSITSTVSVNATAGFSVVTYTGNATANATVGHGLGVTPAMIIIKAKTSAGVESWCVWQQKLGASNYFLRLDSTDAVYTALTNRITAQSSTTFTLGSSVNAETNGSGYTYVSYCWAEIAGFSKFGSYTGNGSTDGPFVYTGFRPRYLLVKRTDSAGYDWFVWDSVRDTINACVKDIYPNISNAEETNNRGPDLLSNGFKMRATATYFNASGGTYIYAAYAENPFKNANAR